MHKNRIKIRIRTGDCRSVDNESRKVGPTSKLTIADNLSISEVVLLFFAFFAS